VICDKSNIIATQVPFFVFITVHQVELLKLPLNPYVTLYSTSSLSISVIVMSATFKLHVLFVAPVNVEPLKAIVGALFIIVAPELVSANNKLFNTDSLFTLNNLRSYHNVPVAV
jgi:hypothetical protein